MKQTCTKINHFGGLVGSSPAMMDIFRMIERAADVNVPVLIVGETGTGKELVAREIHVRSTRRTGPFVAVNTGALSPELVASELFGHVPGAFTGAVAPHEGHFAAAKGGTLFLDEIANMSERIQVVFLRVLEDNVFRPVGAKQDEKANVRLIAATNADLRQAVQAGQFREDLLQRLTVFRIILPPLREHLQDLPMLAAYFLESVVKELNLEVKDISREALNALAKYSWPGNVRELKNAIAQSAIMAKAGSIRLEHIPPRIMSSPTGSWGGEQSFGEGSSMSVSHAACHANQLPTSSTGPNHHNQFVLPIGLPLEEVQQAYVLKTLSACANNKTKAAKTLGISRKTLRDWLLKWGTPTANLCLVLGSF